MLFSTETEDNATGNDDDLKWASGKEEAEATSDCGEDEGPDEKKWYQGKSHSTLKPL